MTKLLNCDFEVHMVGTLIMIIHIQVMFKNGMIL